MSQAFCPFEPEIVGAVKLAAWTEELRRHASGCPVCRETVTLVEFMSRLAEETALTAPPEPDARLIWMRAGLAHRRERLAWFDVFTLAGALFAAAPAIVALFIRKGPQSLASLESLGTDAAAGWLSHIPAGPVLYLFLAGIAAFWLLAPDSAHAEP